MLSTISLAALGFAAVPEAPAEAPARVHGPSGSERVQIAVIPPTADQLPADRRALVLDAVEVQLAADSITVVPRVQVDAELQRLGARCGADPGCREQLAGRVGARFVVLLTVAEPKASDYAIHLEVQEIGVAEPVASFDELCTICSEADLGREIRERTLDARAAILRKLVVPDEVEEAPAVVPLPVVTPPPSPLVRVDVVPSSQLTVAGWGVLGAGIAGTVGGVVLLALHGARAGCPDDPRGGPCIPLVYRTVAPGAATLVGGLALVGVGTGLVVAGRRRDANRRTVQAAPTGAGVVIRGRF